MSSSITVAIPCYAREESLTRCVGEIARCDPLPAEVLIHADGGWEPDHITRLNWPFPLRVIKSKDQIGPGGGRDRLIKESRTDLVASFDDDSWPVDRDYFARAAALMTLFPDTAVLGAEVFLKEKPINLPTSAVFESASFDGSASIHRRSLYLRLPGYVPLAEAYGLEEVDISLQAHAKGMKILFSPWLRAWHDRALGDFAHSTLPWIRNDLLHALLRYPAWLHWLGWLRVARRLRQHATPSSWRALATSAMSAFSSAKELQHHRKIYSFGTIYRHHRGRRRRWLLDDRDWSDKCPPTARQVADSPRIVYLQYTNPGAYPPLEHSSLLLARLGWGVKFIGTYDRSRIELEFPAHPRITMRYLPASAPGWRQKLHYLIFTLYSCWRTWRFKPDWLYSSDPLSTPAAKLVALLTPRLLYHEHDSPTPLSVGQTPRIRRGIARCRKSIATKADVVVLPNQARLDELSATCRPHGRQICVWNCPSLDEAIIPPLERDPKAPLRLLYHGSINPARFPITFLEALAKTDANICIRLIGYETTGSRGYTQYLAREASRLGVSDRFEYLGTLPQRRELMARCAECDAGLSLLDIHGDDINMLHMAGASNKPFDYLSRGLAIIVPDDPEWRRLYVDAGCAVTSDLKSVSKLVETFSWMSSNREQVREMGRHGRELVLRHWNYEHQFAPVLACLEEMPK